MTRRPRHLPPAILIAVTGLVILASLGPASSFQALYSANDVGIGILDNSNFSSFIGHKQKVLWVEYYNSWCGHCIRFAPTWKELAKDILAWKPVIEMAVIDCAEDRNTDICREYEIYLYPSLRYYWLNYSPLRDYKLPAKASTVLGDQSVTKKPEEVGLMYDGELDSIKPLRKGIIDFLEKSWSKGAPREWPDLMSFSAITKEQFFKQLPVSKNKPIMVVLETSDSYIGREIILDLSGYQDKVIVLRVHDLNKDLIKELLPLPLEKYTLPLLLEVNHLEHSVSILCCNPGDKKTDDHRKSFVQMIKAKYVPEEATSSTLSAPSAMNAPSIAKPRSNKAVIGHTEPVYMDDLYNGLRYTIHNQVIKRKKLNSTELNVFKSFLSTIENYFPFDQEKPESFFKLMNKWAATKDHFLDVDELERTLSTFEDDYPLPDMKPYTGCAGSDPRYRGYPCSLWTLFHTLTVNEYLRPQQDQPHEVLKTMRALITNFFGCTECAQNFAKESATMENSLKFKNSSVLWLWKTHNSVNKRLAGDMTEDPMHPKIQFPSRESCPRCYFSNGSFDESAVLSFLVDRHHPEKIVKSMVKKSSDNDIFVGKSQGHTKNDKYHVVSSLTANKVTIYYGLLNRTDISLCLVLYVFSAGLIISLFFIMKFRGRRKKSHNMKYSA